MFLKAKINGISYDKIPADLESLTIDRFLKFRELGKGNDLDLIYWAIDAKPIFKETETIEDELANVLALIDPIVNDIYDFVNSQDSLQVPEVINVMGFDVKLKQGLLNDLPYWPYVVAKTLLRKEFEKGEDKADPAEHIATIVGHYLYSAVTKQPYNEEKAGEFAKSMADELPFKECFQLGNFFLLKQIDLYPQSQKSLLRKMRKIMLRQV